MKKTIILLFAIITLSLSSCNKQDDIMEQSLSELSLENKTKVEVMKDFSKLLGKALVEKQNREYLEDLINNRNDNSEAISVNAILGKKISIEENELLQSSRISKKPCLNNSFKEIISEEIKIILMSIQV